MHRRLQNLDRGCLPLLQESAVFAVSSLEGAQAPLFRFDLPDLGCQNINQVAVMRYQQDRAAELRQHPLQDLLRRQVKVIGRLIQQQQVGALQCQARQRQPAAFPA
ncbi:MAG: hypothetical protein BWY65_02357 [Firmicutes bacterium ADurb.Bin373]|nr:MAG: hypothetical protein BWY65_02357 [Firmicutes bacterium ADurb.Bin373]